ncbi:hypothetical protein CK203_006858 [Vitis vinifera]|uniref:DUF659 domain-containing protein n=1 Tax=Vitis vinifera TaxID=29760 RepID=A0A438KCK3_VITVI|nr:hypothetical protein CK203_006858 [Vitis vinifera]
MGRRHRLVIDEDDEENLGGDDDDGDDDVYMYLADMHPDERHAYREAVRASKAAEWNRQQEEHFIKGKRKTGESSHPTNPTTRQMRKSQSVRYSDPSLPDAPSFKFFIYESVPPSKADSHHFKNMIVGAQQAGMGIEPPSPYEIKHKYLDMEYKDMEAYVNIQREKWKTYGCTIMSDGWTGPTKLSIINFMMRKVCGGDIVRPGATRFATNYIALDSLLKKKANLKKVFISDEWAQHNLSRTLIGKEVESLMFDHAYSERVGKLVSIYEELYTVLRIVDSEVIVGIELLNILFMQQVSIFIFEIYCGVGTDPDLLQVVHEVFAKLDPTSEGLSQFGNEIILFRDAKRGFGDRAAIASRSEMVPLNGGSCMEITLPTLRKLAIKVLSQMHHLQLIRDMKQNMTKLQRRLLDLLDIATEVGEEEDNQLFQWVRPLHLDDEDGNPDPRITAHVREAGVDVDRVLSEEVHTDSFNQTREIHFDKEFLSRQSFLDLSFDSTSVEHSSRPSAIGTSASGYDGSRGEGTMMVATLEMMKGMLDNNNKVDNHWHLLVKMISHIVLKMKTTALEEPVQVLEPLEIHIEEDNEG